MGFSAAAAPSPEKLAQCAWLVKANNRCGRTMRFEPKENRVYYETLRRSALCDDGRDLPFEERLQDADIASMLSQTYPLGRQKFPNLELNQSPGGIRNDDFTMAIYGETPDEVRRSIVNVEFLGQVVPFSKRNGAAAALTRVNSELMELYKSKADPELNKFLEPFVTRANCKPAGRCDIKGNTFVWRLVAGSKRLSNHSFATAIDLQPEWGPQYWLWDVQRQIKDGTAQFREGADLAKKSPRDVRNFHPKRSKHAYPEKLVEVFEKHGFIWGGKWYRYDLMHFEFRPEFFPGKSFPCE